MRARAGLLKNDTHRVTDSRARGHEAAKMNNDSLASLLQRIVFSVAASSALASAGCASTVTPVDTPDSSMNPDDAGATDASAPVDVVTPTRDVAMARDAGPPIDAGPCSPEVTQSSCTGSVRWTCGVPAELQNVTGGLPSEICERYCPPVVDSGFVYLYCSLYPRDSEASLTLHCGYCASGRRSEGLVEPDLRVAGNRVGEFLANCATLENASVTAFERLHAELRAYGAPADLLAAITVAADDERDHTDRMTAASLAWGVRPLAPEFTGTASRSLTAIARENMIEGCVRETWGALVAAWQAAHAEDVALGALFTRVAHDEARHAALSWRMDAWIAPQLDDADRATLTDARDRAIESLEADACARTHPELARVAGLPDASAKRALLDALRAALWS